MLAHRAFAASELLDDVANRIPLLHHRAQLPIFLCRPAVLTIARRASRFLRATSRTAACRCPLACSRAAYRGPCLLFSSCHLDRPPKYMFEAQSKHRTDNCDPIIVRGEYLFGKAYANVYTYAHVKHRVQRNSAYRLSECPIRFTFVKGEAST